MAAIAHPEASDPQPLPGRVPVGSPVSTVVKHLLDHFATTDLAAGSRLPSERVLAETLGIARSTVREALAALEVLGVIDARPGSGTFLRDASSGLLPDTLGWSLLLSERRTADLVELRRVIEIHAAEAAASAITGDELQHLQRHLKAMEENLHYYSRFAEAELAFHLQLAASSANETLAGLLGSILSLLRAWLLRVPHGSHDSAAALDEYVRLFAALKARDSAGARTAMTRHMDAAAARVARAIEPK
jgi:GntR family transcriptional regulator, transcriptional repressor for pyruvate dehydrogenase complex